MFKNRSPILEAPFCTQAAFQHAFDVLQARVVDGEQLPVGGFDRPFFTPGGAYGAGWWSLDSVLAVEGAKWVDLELAKGIVSNLANVQRPDGRIPFWYMDAPEAAVYNVKEEVAGIPKYIEVCWHILRHCGDPALAETAYRMFCRNLQWWEAKRQDPGTGLMTAVFEECLMPQLYTGSMEYAPVDTNMDVITSYHLTAQLAELLGKAEEAEQWRQKMASQQEAVRRYLWDERQETFAPLWVRTGLHEPVNEANAFMTLRHNTASPAQKAALLRLLQDETAYGFEKPTLPSASRRDPRFAVVHGPYIGNRCWAGSVWTSINRSVIRGLREAGEEALAARLALRTAEEFAGRYFEFLSPEDGSGQGTAEYALTAAQFLQIVIDEIFGIHYDVWAGKAELTPLPLQMEMRLSGLTMPDGRRVDAVFRNGDVRLLEAE